MTIGRRYAFSAMAFTLVGLRALFAAQWDRLPSAQPNPRVPPRSMPPDSQTAPQTDPKEALKENLKNLRHNVDQLVQMAQDLKTEADKTDQVDVLSVTFVHKAEAIEKLARQIKSQARLA
jgi:hypothetical protein